MKAGRHHLLHDPMSGSAVFRGVRPAVVVDVRYDEHTADPMDWHGSLDGGSSDDASRNDAANARDSGQHKRDRDRRQDREAAEPDFAESKGRPAPRFDQTLGRIKQQAQPQIEVDWDPDEAPTRVVVGGNKLGMWKPTAAEPFESEVQQQDIATAKFAPSLQAPSLLSMSASGHAPAGPTRRQLPPLPSVLARPTASKTGGSASSSAPTVLSTLAGFSPEERQYFPGQSVADGGEPLRPTRRRWLLPAIGGALIAVVSGSTAYWLFSRPATCDLSIETTPPDARVTLDGKVLGGGASPFQQPDLPVGRHQLLVEKAGYNQHAQAFTLNEHEDKHALTVRLTPEVKVATLSVSSNPSGAEILVDGRSVGLYTPAAVADLNKGQHSVALKLDGYAEGEQSVRVPEDALVSITLVKMGLDPAASTAADASLGGRGARAAARDALRQRRAEIRAARVLAHYRERMGLPPDPATQALLDADDELTGSAEPPATNAEIADAQSAAAAELATGATNMGTLQLNSRPWSEVYVDGEHVGRTPLRALALTTGRHTVRLENPDSNVSKAFEIAIVAGRTLTQTEDLSR